MKIVKLSGGLGNQMFQYAFAVALKNHGNQVLLDDGWFEKVNSGKKSGATKRNFDLSLYNISLPFANAKQITQCTRERFGGIKLPTFLRKYYSRIIKEKNAYSYYEEFLEEKKDAYYAGVFANENYFAKYRSEIVDAFTLKKELTEENKKMLEQIKQTNSVSIHIRRGDYVKLGWVCNLDYYKNAIAEIVKHEKYPHFYIFSDDIPWVRENLQIQEPCTFVDINDGNSGYFDMELMKNCKHNIIANSTFSWWAAWLNPNFNKRVISPVDNQSSAFYYIFR